MKIRLLLLLCLLPILCHPPLRADEHSDVETRLRKDLTFLTSGNCEGRGVDTKGLDRAAEYIAREFDNAGLKPGAGKGSYFQVFPLTLRGTLGTKHTVMLMDGKKKSEPLQNNKDYSVVMLGRKGNVTAPVVFAGYGLSAPDVKYDDYAAIDVKGKIVVVLTGTPRRGVPKGDVFGEADAKRSNRYRDLRTRLVHAAQHQAAGVIVVNSARDARSRDNLPTTFYSVRQGEPVALPVVHVKRQIVQKMLQAAGADLKKLEQQIDADLKPQSVVVKGWKARLQTEVNHTTYIVKNVIGVLEGSGPLKDETVIVGAHYDHMGKGTSSSNSLRRGMSSPGGVGGAGFPLSEINVGEIFHGADDNASGSSCVMELARHFGKSKRSGRRLVFMAFTAEERGLLGSRHYCRNPIYPLEKTAAMINLDMVGRLQDGKMLVSGLGTAKPFRPLIDELNQKHKLALVKRDPSGGSSDHASFLAVNVPIISCFTGFHEQYHRPTDQLPTINITGMRQIVGFVGDIMSHARTMPRPKFTRPSGFVNRSTTLWASAPSVGIRPDFMYEGQGIAVESVVKNSAAAKANLQTGDRVTTVNGIKISGLTQYLALTRKLESGTTVKMMVVRKGKSVPVEIAVELARASRGIAIARLGIELDPTAISRRTPLKNGIRIVAVNKKSPGRKAGIKKGDRLLAVDDVDIKDRNTFLKAFRLLRNTDKVTLGIQRGDKSLRLAAKLSPIIRVRFGFSLDFAGTGKGLLVTNVVANDPAAKAGLKKGDRILKIDGRRVFDRESFDSAASKLSPGNKVGLTILRGGEEMPITVTPAPARRR